jgi:HK97 gp10 family phage protein
VAGELIRIDGITETVQLLEQAPKNVVARGFLKALDAAGQVIVSEVWPRTPLNLKAAVNAKHAGKGALVGKLDAFIELDSQFRGGTVDVGFGDLGHIALWVEYGHRMVGHGRRGKGKVLGNVKPHPFMRPAFEAAGDRAIEAFATSLEATLRSGI